MAKHVKGQEPAKLPLYGAARKRAVQSKKLKAIARLYKLFGIIGALLALMLAYSSYSSTLGSTHSAARNDHRVGKKTKASSTGNAPKKVFNAEDLTLRDIERQLKNVRSRVDEAITYANKCTLLTRVEDFVAAEVACRKAVRIDSKNSSDPGRALFSLLGLMQKKTGVNKYAERVELAETHLLNHPDDKILKYNLAVTHTEEGNTDLAIERYEQNIVDDPDHRNSYHNLGMMLYYKGFTTDEEQNHVIDIITRGFEKGALQNVSPIDIVASGFWQRKDYDMALLWWQRAHEHTPSAESEENLAAVEEKIAERDAETDESYYD
jgi:tetratricopeptide (TPR) repeat protein